MITIAKGCTCKALQALTLVVVLLIDAGRVVLTRPWRALVDVDLTVVALEARHTEAVELHHSVQADGSVLTGLRQTFIHILLTGASLIPLCTHTFKALWAQYAGPIVPAGLIDAVGHMCEAVRPAEPSGTPAEVPVQLVHAHRPWVRAGVAQALIHLLRAVITCESVRADAVVLRGAGSAGAVFTRSKGASVIELITVFAHVSHPLFGTDAGIIITSVHTGSSILAGCRQACGRCGRAESSWKTNQRQVNTSICLWADPLRPAESWDGLMPDGLVVFVDVFSEASSVDLKDDSWNKDVAGVLLDVLNLIVWPCLFPISLLLPFVPFRCHSPSDH